VICVFVLVARTSSDVEGGYVDATKEGAYLQLMGHLSQEMQTCTILKHADYD
jgi:hypothetical protein